MTKFVKMENVLTKEEAAVVRNINLIMMNNQENKQPEDIFENIGPESGTKKGNNEKKYSSGNSEKPAKSKSSKDFRGNKGVFVLIARLLIIVAIIVTIGFLILYFWNRPENKGSLVEGEILIEPTDNVTSTPLIVPEETKEKPLDTDSDGLTDVEEKQLKTEIDNPDTDGDGLSDRMEVKVYFTNPLSADTDKDGILDGEEVKMGLDPDDPNPGAKLFNMEEEIKALE